jgi:polyketide biosynthesis enoyl-CoA hydratase PksI
VGGGLALGLCADIAILEEESRYGCSFMNMGFTPGMGITRLLEHFMAPAVAHELLYTGINYKGRDLKGKTQFNYILPRQEVLPKALELARALAEKTPQVLRLLKRYLSMNRRKLFEETHSIESMMHEISFQQMDILTSIQENYVR